MSFSIKQLLVCMAFVAVGITSLANAGNPFVSATIDVLTLGTLVFMAYEAWLRRGERRAFSIGFVIWGVLYFKLFKQSFDFGIYNVLDTGSKLFWAAVTQAVPTTTFQMQPQSPWDEWQSGFFSIGHSFLLLSFGLIGGWMTVYFCRKRQRTLEQ